MEHQLDSPEIFVANTKAVGQKLDRLNQYGIDKLHVVTDFDRTLTRATIDGVTHSSFSLMWDYLPPSSFDRAQELFNTYYPIERSHTVSVAEKKQKMLEWWTHVVDNYMESGMTRDMIEDVVNSDKLVMRDGTQDFYDLLEQNDVPLLILSSGIGDMIVHSVRDKLTDESNLHVLSNFFSYDDKDKVTGYSSDIIHSFNKRQKLHQDQFYWQQLQNRNCALVLGDTLGDADMVQDEDYDVVIRIGYLNEKISEQRDTFANAFDIVILGDVGMDYINELLAKL